MKKYLFLILITGFFIHSGESQKRKKAEEQPKLDTEAFEGIKWRNIGPFRGGRSVASAGVVSDPMTYYMGSTGGGIWKTVDGGITWKNISDGQLKTGTVGAIAVSESDPNVIYVGMGEHAIRGVMTSSGDGVYKSTDAGKTWKNVGLLNSQHISDVIIHPTNPDIVFVSVQGAQYGPTQERGIYKSTDGGETWKNVLFVNQITGASSLSMDMNNPRILYAAMWEHRRYPWTMQSGGSNSGLYKSVDMGETWTQMEEGLPEEFGKSGISVSRANPELVWAVIEAEGEKGGVYRSNNAGKKWQQVNKDRVNIARSWYYMEIFADPQDENVVYVLNAPVMKSIDGGKTFSNIPVPHGDNHHLWINPTNNQIMINSNDGGANVSFNGGKSWSTQQNQPTAQFYRVITDSQVPYFVYGGQQDNSAIAIASRTNDAGIDWKDWYSVAGCESAYLAFDPDNPVVVYGGCYQGIIEEWIKETGEGKPIKEYPELALGNVPKDFKYRFNWNAPIISSNYDRNTIYHAGNVVFKTTDGGINWEEISPDLTRNDESKQGPGGGPYTNEAAGGENYNTIMYLVESPHEEGVLWAGSDDGLIHITKDAVKNWQNVTPASMPEGIVNSIEVSPHDPATAYITLMRYKFNDLNNYIFKTTNYGQSWQDIGGGIKDRYTFSRVVREDKNVKGLLYAGTETGLYVSWNDGQSWQKLQLNLPVVPINDLIIQDNDLVAATAGRSFWILDDLGPIQNAKEIIEAGKFALVQPKDQYRLFGGSVEEFTPGLGQNPKEGITFDYFLPEEPADSVDFEIKILAGGELIRSFSSKKDEDFKSWPGGPVQNPTLTKKAGYNRFTWDFRRQPLPAVERVFTYGDPRGSRVMPGDYTIRMKMAEDSVETTVSLLPDPRIETDEDEYYNLQLFLVEIEDMVREIHESVNNMRSAKMQLQQYNKLLADNEDAETIIDTSKAIISKIEEWESNLIQPKQKTFQDVINFHNKINSELMNLKSFADVADPTVTMGARLRLSDLKSQWKEFAEGRDEIIGADMKNFNSMYREMNLPAIIMKD